MWDSLEIRWSSIQQRHFLMWKKKTLIMIIVAKVIIKSIITECDTIVRDISFERDTNYWRKYAVNNRYVRENNNVAWRVDKEILKNEYVWKFSGLFFSFFVRWSWSFNHHCHIRLFFITNSKKTVSHVIVSDSTNRQNYKQEQGKRKDTTMY